MAKVGAATSVRRTCGCGQRSIPTHPGNTGRMVSCRTCPNSSRRLSAQPDNPWPLLIAAECGNSIARTKRKAPGNSEPSVVSSDWRLVSVPVGASFHVYFAAKHAVDEDEVANRQHHP